MLTVPQIVLDGATLTPRAVDAVARHGQPVELAPEARERNEAARRAIASILERDEGLYGATTGVGALRDWLIDADVDPARVPAATGAPSSPARR